MLVCTGGGDALRLLLLLSASLDSIISAWPLGYPNRYPNELEPLPLDANRFVLIEDHCPRKPGRSAQGSATIIALACWRSYRSRKKQHRVSQGVAATV